MASCLFSSGAFTSLLLRALGRFAAGAHSIGKQQFESTTHEIRCEALSLTERTHAPFFLFSFLIFSSLGLGHRIRCFPIILSPFHLRRALGPEGACVRGSDPCPDWLVPQLEADVKAVSV